MTFQNDSAFGATELRQDDITQNISRKTWEGSQSKDKKIPTLAQ